MKEAKEGKALRFFDLAFFQKVLFTTESISFFSSCELEGF